MFGRKGPTPIILLLLVIVTKLALALGSHSTLGLLHLIDLGVTGLIASICIIVLEVRRRMGTDGVKVY